ncbi:MULTISPECIES: hypothetical protein [Providencia]|uniref:hypothetical protein n=1 Tax=Providencia TaxID=586 RepID=UPI0005B3149C|nr:MULTISPECIES: hypothetical protein [Providencia]EJD6042674.1 hypothetical protein [Providencia rettgeri]ELR5124380.1 hypothetical protein [Providencia rettgeri]ELR5135110.1 hypothetical protein [Providencia rettgeri]ELR5137789.1 hypothetical protein [Providencia rettgeri]ELR5167327.1 hypothetical protein [Providencia rettgeri]
MKKSIVAILGLVLFSTASIASTLECEMPLSKGEYSGVLEAALKGVDKNGTFNQYYFVGDAPTGQKVKGCLDTITSVHKNLSLLQEFESAYSSKNTVNFLVNDEGRIYEFLRTQNSTTIPTKDIK